jgi:2-methylisocitrate lyase-like PEP mutase family enzyme
MTTPKLRARLRQPAALLVPGVYDALTALAAEQAGFEAVYLSGGAVAYTQLGRSDVGLTTASETADVLGRIADRVEPARHR